VKVKFIKSSWYVGVRGLDIDGGFVKFTGLGVYLEEKAVASLTPKWKSKTPSQLFESLDFYRDIIKGSNILLHNDSIPLIIFFFQNIIDLGNQNIIKHVFLFILAKTKNMY